MYAKVAYESLSMFVFSCSVWIGPIYVLVRMWFLALWRFGPVKLKWSTRLWDRSWNCNMPLVMKFSENHHGSLWCFPILLTWRESGSPLSSFLYFSLTWHLSSVPWVLATPHPCSKWIGITAVLDHGCVAWWMYRYRVRSRRRVVSRWHTGASPVTCRPSAYEVLQQNECFGRYVVVIIRHRLNRTPSQPTLHQHSTPRSCD